MKRSVKAVIALAGCLAVVLLVGSCIAPIMLRLGAFAGSSVRRVNQADPELVAAIKKARAGLPEFISELRSPRDGQRFAIEAQFPTSQGPEYLWLRDPKFNGKSFRATLDQSPMAAKVRKGDLLEIRQADVVDWLIRDPDGTTRGRFTDKALGSGITSN